MRFSIVRYQPFLSISCKAILPAMGKYNCPSSREALKDMSKYKLYSRSALTMILLIFNSLRPRQNGRLFADETFKRIFLNENIRLSTKNSLKFVPKGPINNIPALFQIMAWRRPGDKPLSEPMLVCLLTHICVTRPQWVKPYLPPP